MRRDGAGGGGGVRCNRAGAIASAGDSSLEKRGASSVRAGAAICTSIHRFLTNNKDADFRWTSRGPGVGAPGRRSWNYIETWNDT